MWRLVLYDNMDQVEDIPSGLLSKGQRKYLLGGDVADKYSMDHRLRERIRHGLVDFSILYEHHPDSQRAKTFERSERERIRQELDESRNLRRADSLSTTDIRDSVLPGMRDAIAYFYLGLIDRGYGTDNFEELIRNAVKQAEERLEEDDTIVDVGVSITAEPRGESRRELREMYLAGEELSRDQMLALIETDPGIVVDFIKDWDPDEE